MVQVGLVLVDLGLHGPDILVGGLQAGLGGRGIGLGGVEGGVLGIDVGLGLDVLDAGQQLALADAVAFLDQNLRELALGVGADVDVILGLNLARGGHQAGQILAHDVAGLHRDDAPLAENGAGVNADREDQNHNDADENLPLALHDKNLPYLTCHPLDAKCEPGVQTSFYTRAVCSQNQARCGQRIPITQTLETWPEVSAS